MIARDRLAHKTILTLALMGAGWLSSPAIADDGGPVVTVSGGALRGAATSGGAVFKGIPFAQPPVGDLRWAEPLPARPWAGTLDATQYAAPCAQGDSGWNKAQAAAGREDCLYLNVWTPGWPMKGKAPVMVWIHGGGNSGGSAMGGASIEPPFDGASLARRGVLVVTLNYRLGVLGYLGHAELTAQSPHHASGDYGQLDQIAALRWVQANIARFGGDPANVTLFGQSAGAQNTTILAGSPLTVGLFSKIIAQSGTPMIDDKRLMSHAQVEQAGAVLASALKAPETGAIAYMRALPVGQVLAAAQVFREKHIMLDASIDGYVVPAFSPDAYKAGVGRHLPLLIGSNGMDSPGQRPATGSAQEIRADLRKRVESFYARYPDLLTKALAIYGLRDSDPVPSVETITATSRNMGVDRGFRCENTALATWHSAGAPTFEYQFTAGTPAHPPLHSAELDFTFGYLRDQAQVPELVKLSDTMQRYWTNFAKTGNPNGPGLPVWRPYTTATRAYLDFSNKGPVAQADLGDGACALYREKLTRDLAQP